ncbi:MAG: methylenetetrahydrofolate reductase [Gemmataceae bacterium]
MLGAHRTTFSFEFFPPKTDEGFDELIQTIARLQELKPSFVSVTYGAGGSTRERTHDLIVRIQRETDLTAVSHLTCVCHSEPELAAILDRYAESGIENVLALGGDPPQAGSTTTARRTPFATPATWSSSSVRGQGAGQARLWRRRRRVPGWPPGHAEPAARDGPPQA